MNLARLCLTSTALLLTTGPGLADEVLGTWLRDNGVLKIKFEPCGDAVCGNIVWLKPGFESRAKIGQRLFFDMPVIQVLAIGFHTIREEIIRAAPINLLLLGLSMFVLWGRTKLAPVQRKT
jgi:hypothetical protein